jgi:hypothetical protein
MTALKIPFIALHKENLKTPGRVAFFERIYAQRRGPFTGSLVIVYNEIERTLQIRTGVGKRVKVCGMSRLDRAHSWRKANSGNVVRGHILFFAFASTTGMPRVSRKTGAPGSVYFEDNTQGGELASLDSLCAITFSVIRNIAETHPEIAITVKTKGRQRDYNDTLRSLGYEAPANYPSNLKVAHSGDPLPLIAEASVVCGFNSTTLCETLAAGKPVVLPRFAEALSPEVLPYLLDLRKACFVAESVDTLRSRLIDLALNPLPVHDVLGGAVKEALDYWVGNSEGDASGRVRKSILNELALQ